MPLGAAEIVAITVAGATPTGAAIAWAAGWLERRGQSRQTKLDAWHTELAQREKALDAGQTRYTARLEERLGEMEARELDRERKDEARDLQMTALRIALDLVSGALRRIDPNNVALSQTAELLKAHFPVSAAELHMPDDMLGSLRLLLNQPGVSRP